MKKKRLTKKKAGLIVASKAAKNPAFGRRIDKLPHKSRARNRMAGI